jgi:hypothetical protein
MDIARIKYSHSEYINDNKRPYIKIYKDSN